MIGIHEWRERANRCPELVPWKEGTEIVTECGLRRGHDGPCVRVDECYRCGATEGDLREAFSLETDERYMGYGPNKDRCLYCWEGEVEGWSHPPLCVECGCNIEPRDVDDPDARYICVVCDPREAPEANRSRR